MDESYSQLPPEFLMVECAGRDKLGVEVLNDRWVSIP